MKINNAEKGKSTLLDLFLIGLVCFVGFLLYKRGDFNRFLPPEWQTKVAAASPTPAPAAEPSATPAAEIAQSTPASTPEAAPSSTPPEAQASSTPATAAAAPVEEKIDLAMLDRRYWPQQVKLMHSMELPVILNGTQVGSAQAPAGYTVRLLDAKGDQVKIQSGEAVKWLGINETDTISRVKGVMKLIPQH